MCLSLNYMNNVILLTRIRSGLVDGSRDQGDITSVDVAVGTQEWKRKIPYSTPCLPEIVKELKKGKICPAR